MVVLLGNKCDLKGRDDLEMVPQSEIDELVQESQIKYFPTSAKEDINVYEAFQFVAQSIIEKEREVNISSMKDLRMTSTPHQEKKSCCSSN